MTVDVEETAAAAAAADAAAAATDASASASATMVVRDFLLIVRANTTPNDNLNIRIIIKCPFSCINPLYELKQCRYYVYLLFQYLESYIS